MGVALSQPVTSKLLYRHGSANFKVGACSMQGWRYNMEDAHTICLSLPGHNDTAFFGIFDGHGGDTVSKLVAKELVALVSKLKDPHDPKDLKKACLDMDDVILKKVYSEDGSAAVFAVVTRQKTGDYKLTVGNIGDSRVILGRFRNGQLSMIPMTVDHKPTDPKESERIIKAGGTVQAGRVAGSLALSRAFGDRNFKIPVKNPPEKFQVIAIPDFKTTTVTGTDFLFLACDGIFESDIFTRQGVISYIHYKLEAKNDLADIMAELLEECLKRGSNDNMSAMLIQFCDGVSYNMEQPEFVSGPYHEGERHTSFQKAYAEDAKLAGYSVDQARSLYTRYGGYSAMRDESKEKGATTNNQTKPNASKEQPKANPTDPTSPKPTNGDGNVGAEATNKPPEIVDPSSSDAPKRDRPKTSSKSASSDPKKKSEPARRLKSGLSDDTSPPVKRTSIDLPSSSRSTPASPMPDDVAGSRKTLPHSHSSRHHNKKHKTISEDRHDKHEGDDEHTGSLLSPHAADEKGERKRLNEKTVSEGEAKSSKKHSRSTSNNRGEDAPKKSPSSTPRLSEDSDKLPSKKSSATTPKLSRQSEEDKDRVSKKNTAPNSSRKVEKGDKGSSTK